MFAKDILKDVVKVDDVDKAVLRECGFIASRATGSEQTTPRLTNEEKTR